MRHGFCRGQASDGIRRGIMQSYTILMMISTLFHCAEPALEGVIFCCFDPYKTLQNETFRNVLREVMRIAGLNNNGVIIINALLFLIIKSDETAL